MADPDSAAESRWRMSRQTMSVRDLAADAREFLAGAAGPARWPAEHARGAAELGDHLRQHAEALDRAQLVSDHVDELHRSVIRESATFAREIDATSGDMVAAREHLLRAAVTSDAASAAEHEMDRKLTRMRGLLD